MSARLDWAKARKRDMLRTRARQHVRRDRERRTRPLAPDHDASQSDPPLDLAEVLRALSSSKPAILDLTGRTCAQHTRPRL